jgi:peptidyl-dipeptidase Dcp
MKKSLILIIVVMSVISSCKQKEKEEKPSNPFFSEYNTLFGVPPFDLIDTSHYIPAFEAGIAEEKAEIDAIVNNTEEPTFENTILPFDKSGKLLKKVGRVFYNLNGANTNDALQAIARKISPLTTQHSDDIMLNDKLFQKIKTVYENRNSGKLNDQQIRLVEKIYQDFERNGANLSDDDKEKLRALNQKLSENQLKFRENLLAETNKNFKLIIEEEKDLAGLPQGSVDAAAETAKEEGMEGKWVFTLQKPSLIPFLQYADNRDLREKIYRGYYMRGNNNDMYDNKEIIFNIANLRSEKAKLLSYDTYADFIIDKNMAKTPEKVYEFLDQVMEPALEAAISDRDEMQKIIDAEGGDFKLESWDWWYYAEKLKKQKFDLDESEIKPYFVLENVRDGMFWVANNLYGINFTKLEGMPVYHPDVEVYEATEADGSHIGILYLDYFPRPGKRFGAWCSSFRPQSYEDGKKIYPVATIVTNFTKPSGDKPALLTWDEVNTLFHEFGHSLHGLFTDGKYNRTAGNIPRDMVELPSQIMEHWTAEPAVINYYAKHYETGEVMPQELIDKIQKSLVFNSGFNTVEYIAASVLDLDWHSLEEPTETDVLTFEKESMNRIHLIKEIIPRYRSTYFAHIIGGYAAGYYVYLWAEVLDSDAFEAYKESGDIFNKDIAAAFRKNILAEGGSDEGMIQYRKFRGKDPSIEGLLKKRGFAKN